MGCNSNNTESEIVRLTGMGNPSVILTKINKSNIEYILKLRPVNAAYSDDEHSGKAKQTNVVFLLTRLFFCHPTNFLFRL